MNTSSQSIWWVIGIAVVAAVALAVVVWPKAESKPESEIGEDDVVQEQLHDEGLSSPSPTPAQPSSYQPPPSTSGDDQTPWEQGPSEPEATSPTSPPGDTPWQQGPSS